MSTDVGVIHAIFMVSSVESWMNDPAAKNFKMLI